MKHKNRFIVLCTLLLICTAFSGCGSHQQPPASSSEQSNQSSSTESGESNLMQSASSVPESSSAPAAESSLPSDDPHQETSSYDTTGTGSSNPPKSSSGGAAHQHSYITKVVSPTCTKPGYTLHTCACGNSYQDKSTAALGHSYGEWVVVKEPTESSTGLEECTCKRCGDKKTEVTEKRQHKATAADSRAVAQKMLEYINQFRQEQGVPAATRLPGLTVYAEYRSRQIISNFSHDTNDERAAATALKYGEYINPADYGMTGSPYYSAGAGEAIAKGGYTGTIDEVAERLARQVKNSAGHWAYVGGAKYRYIAVGITYESGTWYCDVAMAIENTDSWK